MKIIKEKPIKLGESTEKNLMLWIKRKRIPYWKNLIYEYLGEKSSCQNWNENEKGAISEG